MKHPRGFTIFEMVVALGLLLLLVSIGYLFSFSYFQTQQLRAAADLVASEIRQAQADSYTQANDATHGVKIFPDRVTRFQGTSYATRDTSEDIQTEFPLPVTLAGTDEIVFTTGGLTPASAGTITMSHDTLAIDIAISAYGLLTLTERTIGS